MAFRRISTLEYLLLVELDTLDRAVVEALRLDGRVPFSVLAEVLGVSDQTVARRYRRLRAEAGLRVAGLPDGVRLGYDIWLIRLQAPSDTAISVAEALARRPDTTWITLMSGGTEVTCVVQGSSGSEREALLLQKLPRTPRLGSVRAYCLMHYFVGGPVGGESRITTLTPEQVARLRPPPPAAPPGPPGPGVLESDGPLLTALARDGRLGHPELAAATGWSESKVRRRLDQLRSAGAVFFDVDVDSTLLGFHARVMLWLTVAPGRLAEVGAALAGHPQIVFAAATTGETNLVATVVCPDMAGLYAYLTTGIGALPGVERLESTPAVRHVKQTAARWFP